MHDAVAHELSMFQARNHREHPLLFAPFQVGLEAHQIIEGAGGVLGPQLDIGPGTVAGAGVPQPHRAQRPKPDGIGTAGRHDLDGHTALVHGQIPVKIVERGPFGTDERRMEGLVLLLIKGAV